jgi:uncharacterized protein with HEPN domain
MQPRDAFYLQHILAAIARIERYLTDVDQQRFKTDELIQDGVIRQLEIIGEAVKRLSPATRQQAPEIPWSAIAGMRDKLIHHYFGVDLEQVWLTTQINLAPLKAVVTHLLSSDPD